MEAMTELHKLLAFRAENPDWVKRAAPNGTYAELFKLRRDDLALLSAANAAWKERSAPYVDKLNEHAKSIDLLAKHGLATPIDTPLDEILYECQEFNRDRQFMSACLFMVFMEAAPALGKHYGAHTDLPMAERWREANEVLAREMERPVMRGIDAEGPMFLAFCKAAKIKPKELIALVDAYIAEQVSMPGSAA